MGQSPEDSLHQVWIEGNEIPRAHTTVKNKYKYQ